MFCGKGKRKHPHPEPHPHPHPHPHPPRQVNIVLKLIVLSKELYTNDFVHFKDSGGALQFHAHSSPPPSPSSSSSSSKKKQTKKKKKEVSWKQVFPEESSPPSSDAVREFKEKRNALTVDEETALSDAINKIVGVNSSSTFATFSTFAKNVNRFMKMVMDHRHEIDHDDDDAHARRESKMSYTVALFLAIVHLLLRNRTEFIEFIGDEEVDKLKILESQTKHHHFRMETDPANAKTHFWAFCFYMIVFFTDKDPREYQRYDVFTMDVFFGIVSYFQLLISRHFRYKRTNIISWDREHFHANFQYFRHLLQIDHHHHHHHHHPNTIGKIAKVEDYHASVTKEEEAFTKIGCIRESGTSSYFYYYCIDHDDDDGDGDDGDDDDDGGGGGAGSDALHARFYVLSATRARPGTIGGAGRTPSRRKRGRRRTMKKERKRR